jgi:hypothetical protein
MNVPSHNLIGLETEILRSGYITLLEHLGSNCAVKTVSHHKGSTAT